MDIHTCVHLHTWVAPGALCESFFLITLHIFLWYFSTCSIPHNPIYIICSHNETSKISKVNPERYKGLHTRLSYLQGLSLSDVNMTWTDRGVYFSPAQHIKVIIRFIFLKYQKEKESSIIDQIFQLTSMLIHSAMCQRGCSNDKMGFGACPESHVKRVFLHSWTLYVSNVK